MSTANNGATIRRAPRPESRFTTISKDITENTSLSWQARGLLVYLLGKFDNWQVNVSHLQKETRDAKKKSGRDAIFGILEELMDTGYLQREQLRDDKGGFIGVQYVVHEVPVPLEMRTIKTSKAAANESDKTGQDDDLKGANPNPENPDTDNPNTGLPDTPNPPLLNNDSLPRTDLTEADAKKQGNAELMTMERRWAPDVQKPQGLDDQIWIDLLRIRKSKASVLTPSAMQRMQSEADKAGLSLADAIAYAAGKSWIAFTYAYWLSEHNREQQAQQRAINGSTVGHGGYRGGANNAVMAAAQNVYDFDDKMPGFY